MMIGLGIAGVKSVAPPLAVPQCRSAVPLTVTVASAKGPDSTAQSKNKPARLTRRLWPGDHWQARA